MIETSAAINVLLFVLAVTGALVSAIAGMIYRRIGAIESLIRETVRELQKEDKLLHGRVTSLDSRVTRMETRCDTFHRSSESS